MGLAGDVVLEGKCKIVPVGGDAGLEGVGLAVRVLGLPPVEPGHEFALALLQLLEQLEPLFVEVSLIDFHNEVVRKGLVLEDRHGPHPRVLGLPVALQLQALEAIGIAALRAHGLYQWDI
jgi:hypothetical protein